MSHLPESNTMQIRINQFMALSAARRLWIMALAMVLVPGCTVLGDKEQTIKN